MSAVFVVTCSSYGEGAHVLGVFDSAPAATAFAAASDSTRMLALTAAS